MKSAKEREELMRKVVKAVVHCDLTHDPLIQKGYDEVYDVVMSLLAIDTVPKTDDEFVTLLCRVGNLVKLGGTILLYFAENVSEYYVGDAKFYSFTVTVETAVTALAKAGFKDIETSDKYYSRFPHEKQDYTFFFLKAIRY